MKTNTICCTLLTKNFTKRVICDFKSYLLLFFFLGLFSTSTFAQNSCFISGNAASAPYPKAEISAVINGNQLQYRVTPSAPSSYLWTLTNNTSGASLIGTIAPVAKVNPGSSEGSFTLTCRVTRLDNPSSVNTCTVSVAVKSQ